MEELAAPVQERCSSDVLPISKSSQGAPCSARSQSTRFNLPWGSEVFAFRCYAWLEIFSRRANVRKEWKIIHVVVCVVRAQCWLMRLALVLPCLGKVSHEEEEETCFKASHSLESVLPCVRLGCGSAGTVLNKREMSIPRHGG